MDPDSDFSIERFYEPPAAAWERMTFPAYQPLLTELRSGTTVALGAKNRTGNAIGLCLATMISAGEAELLSVFVEKPWRGSGVGTRLLRQIENEIRESAHHRRRLVLTYSSSLGSAAAVERLLAKCDWSQPRPNMLLVRVGQEMTQAPWFLGRELPPPLHIVPWLTLTPEQRNRLEQSQRAQHWAPEALWPFRYEDGIEPCNSLALCSDDDVVGWIITHRIAAKVVRYTAVFVREEYRRPAREFFLIAEAGRRQLEAIGYDSIGTFGVLMENTAMVRIVQRKLAPWARSLATSYFAEKQLLGADREDELAADSN